MSLENKDGIKDKVLQFAEKYGIFIVLVVLFIIGSILNENFMTFRNIQNIGRQVSIITILALGETLVLISGMLDLSNGSVLALAGVVSVSVYILSGSLLLAFLVAVIIGIICNVVNGVLVTKFGTPAFIATLAMLTMARGAALLYTKGQNIYGIGNYTVFGQGVFFGIPTPIWFMGLIVLITWYVLRHTRLGRSIYSIGGNEEAAIASGININKNKMLAFIINGVFVGIAGVVFMSRVNAGIPNGAQGYEFNALTAAVVGGTSLSGGIGTAWGTVTGSFIVGILNNIMNLMNVNSYLQQIIRGAIIALAVIYDIRTKKLRKRFKKGERTEK
ncbi:MAG: ABC transporter permease [Halanaerobiaceae bacterium]